MKRLSTVTFPLLLLLLSTSTSFATEEARKLIYHSDNLNSDLNLKSETFFQYIKQWNSSLSDDSNPGQEDIATTNDLSMSNSDDLDLSNTNDLDLSNPNDLDLENSKQAIESTAEEMFKSSEKESTLILTDLTRCVAIFTFFTCVKMLLLNRVKTLAHLMESTSTHEKDLNLLHGLVTFKWVNDSREEITRKTKDVGHNLLDEELTSWVLRLFKSRSLHLNILPGFGIELTPKSVPDSEDFVCFTAKTFVEPSFNATADVGEERNKAGDNKDKKKKKKKGGFSMMPMMMMPQMIMMGFMPFALANLKMMVMNAFMMNTMALNSAILMTIRNMVFGQKRGPKIKYVNYGYEKGKRNKKPEIVLHSPAAFVKGPLPQPTLQLQENVQSSDFGYPPLENYNSYPPNDRNHLRRTENKLRKPEIRPVSHNGRIRLRTRLEDVPPEVKRIVTQMAESHEQSRPSRPTYHKNRRNPIGVSDVREKTEPTFSTVNNDHSYSAESTVDAPHSYLNNNQILLPTKQYNSHFANSETNVNRGTDSYQAYNNVHLQSKSHQQSNAPLNPELDKNYYSAKYSEQNTQFSDNYNNHRLN